MRAVMGRTSLESSSSKRNFKWVIRKGSGGGESGRRQWKVEQDEDILSSSTSTFHPPMEKVTAAARKRTSAATVAISRFRSVLMAAITSCQNRSTSRGSRMTGTLYGHRHGHVHLAFQVDSQSCPMALLELATPTSVLVREMASGLVRIALECEQRACNDGGKGARRLLEEPMWRAYCNGKKCGYAVKRECGPADWKVLKAIEPVSMGAGVLPGDGETMYMRARFERVVGSRDSEAFYMMNPDGNGCTELSIYFLRV